MAILSVGLISGACAIIPKNACCGRVLYGATAVNASVDFAAGLPLRYYTKTATCRQKIIFIPTDGGLLHLKCYAVCLSAKF